MQKNFWLYPRLSAADRAELHGHILVFLAEKRFEGCGGIGITEEIKVTIAAQACLLLLHRKTDYYPLLSTVLVYPTMYVAPDVEEVAPGILSEIDDTRIGEAWETGAVVLAWDEVRAGASDVRDGQNVVLHEFAHQLDQEAGEAEGTPALERRSKYVVWARVLGAAYKELRRDARLGRETVLDTYGATNPAEFFAVVTESFFENPVQLKKRHPALYEELKEFYRQDPVRYWEGEEVR